MSTPADDETLINRWNSKPYRQKSRAITNLETRVRRFRVPSTPPLFALGSREDTRLGCHIGFAARF